MEMVALPAQNWSSTVLPTGATVPAFRICSNPVFHWRFGEDRR
jgi:hypothetical protein